MVIKVSRTAIINPPGVSPVLTVDQLWQGMVIKARKPQEFVKLMESCKVLKEDETGLTRVVTFKNGWGPPGGKAEEEIKYYAPMRVSQQLLERSGHPTDRLPSPRSTLLCSRLAKGSATSSAPTRTMTASCT